MHAEVVIKTLDNVLIMFDNEVMNGNKKHVNVFVYDGNFLRESFEKELLMLSDEILPNVYCLRSSIHASPNLIGQNCHARSIRVKRVCPHKNVIDRLCDANEKFEYLNTAGGLMMNRETDRLKDRKNHSLMIVGQHLHSFYLYFHKCLQHSQRVYFLHSWLIWWKGIVVLTSL